MQGGLKINLEGEQQACSLIYCLAEHLDCCSLYSFDFIRKPYKILYGFDSMCRKEKPHFDKEKITKEVTSFLSRSEAVFL